MCITDAGGNLMFISLTTMDKELLLVNVYGPNRDSPEFYDEMEDHVSEMGLSNIINGRRLGFSTRSEYGLL